VPLWCKSNHTAIPGSLRHTVHPVHGRTAIPGSLRHTVHPVHKKGPLDAGLLRRQTVEENLRFFFTDDCNPGYRINIGVQVQCDLVLTRLTDGSFR
jgi:hypothetical protein